MPIRRNIFTGEIEEFESSPDGRQIVSRERLPYGEQTVMKRHRNPYNKPWRSRSLGVPYYQAAEFNEAAKAAGTGAFYDMRTGEMVCESKSSRKREVERRGMYDNDGGYSDPQQG